MSGLSSSNAWEQVCVETVKAAFPDVQAIYRFGSAATPAERVDSDIDLALLLPVSCERSATHWHELRTTLAQRLQKPVDLLDVRRCTTVFQKEVISAGVCIDCADRRAQDEFEMLVLSFYGSLNAERAAITQAFWQTGRAYHD